MVAALTAPHIDYAAISPLLALGIGTCFTLLFGLARGSGTRTLVTTSALLTLGAAAALSIWQLGTNEYVVEGALRIDDFALCLGLVFFSAAALALVLSLGEDAAERSNLGDYSALLLVSVTGMTVLASSANLITLFLGIELLSIPLYVLCALDLRRETSLESGLKYLVIGSFGSATLLYGLAMIYGATGATDFTAIADALGSAGVLGDPLLLTGIGLAVVGLAFKASVAPFHQWTPDVYEGAPTPVTSFMAVATKAAAFAIIVRFFEQALLPAQPDWDAALAALAVASIVIGNVAAIGQDSLKRMLAYSGIAQAGYMLVGVVVGTQLGVKALVFYLFVYTLMNVAAFAVVIARERESAYGDDIESVSDIGRTRPLLAWPLTIAMLSLAGFPATAGFFGKFFLIEAAVSGGYTWLGVAIVVGSMVSLAYYLRVVAAVWMRPAPAPAIAGASPEAEPASPGQPQVLPAAVAVATSGAVLFFGVIPSPLLDLAGRAARSLTGLP
ncbi:MAG: NADH-quinone oxidoreductase subunit N [Solirubrobacterales bacterium]